jgi:predicted ester cyclase
MLTWTDQGAEPTGKKRGKLMDRRDALKTALLGGAAAALVAADLTPAEAAARPNHWREANQLLDKMVEAINKHDVSLLDQVYATDGYINHQVLLKMGGNNAKTMGREQAKNYFAARFKAFPDIMLETDVRTGYGDLIAANLIWRGTQQGEYLGIPATGKKVAWNSTDILKVRDNLFSEHWGAVDFYGLVKQLKG